MSDDNADLSGAMTLTGGGPPRGAVKLKLAMELSRCADQG